MSYALIEQKLYAIPEEYLGEIAEYLDSLSARIAKAAAPQPLRKAGVLKGKLLMSEDFDETPADFKEYM